MKVKMTGYSDKTYLKKVTEAMAAFRREAPSGGLYTAGDLNWWWRDDAYGEAANQVFWEDEQGKALAFGLLSPGYRAFDYEFLPSLGESHPAVQEMFRWGLAGLARTRGACSIAILDSHTVLRTSAEDAGFTPSGESSVETALKLPAPHTLPRSPEGYTVRSLQHADLVDGGTPVLRQKAKALRRVQEAPLYQQDLHLVVQAPGGRLAAECIVWLGEVNKIGVFEPVRTHADFCRRGLGRAMLAEGVRRMERRGVTLARVGYLRSNLAAKGLYESLGFRKVFEKLDYQRVFP